MLSCGVSRHYRFNFEQMFDTCIELQFTTKPRNYRLYNVMGWFSLSFLILNFKKARIIIGKMLYRK